MMLAYCVWADLFVVIQTWKSIMLDHMYMFYVGGSILEVFFINKVKPYE
jgi:hypothetical protein